jgi:hypothetical protein
MCRILVAALALDGMQNRNLSKPRHAPLLRAWTKAGDGGAYMAPSLGVENHLTVTAVREVRPNVDTTSQMRVANRGGDLAGCGARQGKVAHLLHRTGRSFAHYGADGSEELARDKQSTRLSAPRLGRVDMEEQLTVEHFAADGEAADELEHEVLIANDRFVADHLRCTPSAPHSAKVWTCGLDFPTCRAPDVGNLSSSR